MKTTYLVKWSKEFVSGPLKGLHYPSQLGFDSLDDATRYVAFLHEHTTKPLMPGMGISQYTCYGARIVKE